MRLLLRNLRGTVVFILLSLNTVLWFIPILVFALVKLLLPIPPLRNRITRLLAQLAENWVSVNRWLLAGSGAMQWSAEGLSGLKRNGWYLVLANHQTWVDIVVLQSVFNRRIPFLKFFIKQELVWFPVLGVAWWALDMPFMKRHSPSYLAKHPEKKGSDLEATRKACRKFRDTPTSVILFVEGTRYSDEKRDNRHSPYRHLLKPRAGGVAIALASMGELFDAVLDVTVVYPDGVPKFWGMCCGDRVNAVVNVEQKSIDPRLLAGNYELDRDFRRQMHAWIGELWQQKDERITGMLADSH